MVHESYHHASSTDEKIAVSANEYLTAAGRAALDVLRVLGLGALVWYHVALLFAGEASSGFAKAILVVGRMGYVGTDLLLALAGFLAVASFERAGSSLRFLRRRLVRVFPGLFAFLLIYLVVLPALLGTETQTLPNYGDLSRARSLWPLLGTMTANFVMVAGQRIGAALEPMLTLGVGAQLTVVAAFILASRRRLWIGAAAAIFLGFVLRALWLHADEYVPYSFPLCRCEGFLLGAVCASLLRWERMRLWLRDHRFHILVLVTIPLLGLVVALKGLPLSSPLMKTLGYPLVGSWCAALVLAASQLSSCPGVLRMLGKIAPAGFSIYLVKLPVVFVVSVALPLAWTSSVLRFLAVALAASFAAGVVFYALVERPARGIASRIFARKSATDASPATD